MKIEVFIDYGSSTEKIAVFYDEETYQNCVTALEALAKECDGVLTESLIDDDEPLNQDEKELLESLLNQYKSWSEDDGLEPEDVKEIDAKVDTIFKKLKLTTKEEQS